MDQFRPPKSFRFPKRRFGSKGEERYFRVEWYEQFDWLHYDIGLDAAFCYLCMKSDREKKFLPSTKREQAFISRGFTYWKEATTVFKKHMSSDCHRQAVEALIVLLKCTKDIGELQSAQHAAGKAKNQKMFLLVLNNLRSLAGQGLPLRSNGEETNSNFIQLLHLRVQECSNLDVDAWLGKRINKYTSPEVDGSALP